MFTTKQAASVLGVSRRRVVQLITAGRLGAIRVGHAYVVSEGDLASYQPRPAGRPKQGN